MRTNMCVARLTVQRYDIFGAGANFPAQKQGCFSKHAQFSLWPVFVACFLGPEQRNREQITVEQKLKCRKNPLRILYNI
ncbi:MAG: hypothetical protein PUB62_03180, partial [Prevotellaceae bacterium]|nr:hypothetical protein [Prevotellaceae bacterium]